MRALLVAASLLSAAAAHAQAPGTRIGALGGARANMGALGNRYSLGYVVGIEAGLMPSWFGVVWSLQYSSFASSDPRNVEDTLELFDLDLAARIRLAPRPDVPAWLWFQLGFDLLRSKIPVEPDLDTMYYGPTARVGGELVLGKFILSLGADYGLIVDGPSGLRLLFFVGVGD
jgi:hypothetical protein